MKRAPLSLFIGYPKKFRPRGMRTKSRVHHTQVLLKQAERAFDEVRTDSGLYMRNSNPPTPYEIRSLVAALYRDAGWPRDSFQAAWS